MTVIDVVLALDPGKTTGWASYQTNETSAALGKFDCGQLDFTGTAGLVDAWTAALGERLLVVSESFIINMQTVKNTAAPWSLELIGVFRYFSMTRCHRDLVLQQPASAKRMCSNDRLKGLGWYVPGQGHAMDAARHLILALSTRGLISNETLLGMV